MEYFLKLIGNYKEFYNDEFTSQKSSYQEMAQGQSPKVMVIGCCDSRVSLDRILRIDPGEVFVVRNVANLVPPFEKSGRYHGTSAAIEFGIKHLKVRHIAIMGHSQCGGVKACIEASQTDKKQDETLFIGSWVSMIAAAMKRIKDQCNTLSHEEIQFQTELEAIKQSIANLHNFPFVKAAMKEKSLYIHGLHFDIGTGQLRRLDNDLEQFDLI